jgi:hypothetical protein
VQLEGFAGGGSAQCGPLVPVFSAFGVAAGLAEGLAAGVAAGVGAFLLAGGEGWQLVTNTAKIKLNIPIRSVRFMGHAPLR